MRGAKVNIKRIELLEKITENRIDYEIRFHITFRALPIILILNSEMDRRDIILAVMKLTTELIGMING